MIILSNYSKSSNNMMSVKESSYNTNVNNQKFNLKLRFETYILMADCILSIFDVGRHILRKSMKTWRQVVATRDCKNASPHYLPLSPAFFAWTPSVPTSSLPSNTCLLLYNGVPTVQLKFKCILSILFTSLLAWQTKINYLASKQGQTFP